MFEYASLKQLWLRSLISLKDHWQPVLIGACFFGSAMAIIANKTMAIVQSSMAEAVAKAGIKQDVFSGILESAKAATDTESLLQVLSAQQEAMGAMDPVAQLGMMQEQALLALSTLLPILVTAVLIAAIVSYFAMHYYFVMAVQKHKNALQILYDIIRYILPMFALSMWVSLRSFIWVPFIGVLIAFIYTPRFSLSGVLLVSENLGIFTAAKESFALTRGLWYKIIHQTYLTTILTSIVYYITIFFIKYLGLTATMGAIVRALVAQLLLAYVMIFVVELSFDIIKTKRKIFTYETSV